MGYERIVTILSGGECGKRNCLRPKLGKSKKRGGIFFLSILTLIATLSLNAFLIYPFNLEAITFITLSALTIGFISSVMFVILHLSDPGSVRFGKFDGPSFLKLLKEN